MRVDLNRLNENLFCLLHVKKLSSLCSGHDAYFVGGAVRDALIGNQIKDVDLIFPADPTQIAKSFARQIGGNWFWLDEARKQSRVVVNNQDDAPDFDFAPFRAPSLGQDLLDRDFTINAIALPLHKEASSDSLVDPVCGIEDLSHGLLRMVTPNAITNDPLRIIKGLRHATVLELSVDDETLSSMKQEVTGLYNVAVERVRQEIWKTLSSDHAAYGLDLLHESLAGNYLFGNVYSSTVDSLKELLEVFRSGWRCLRNESTVAGAWLENQVEQGFTVEVLLLWTLLLSRVDPKLPCRLAEEWMLSRKSRTNIKSLSENGANLLKEFVKIGPNARSYGLLAQKHRIDPKIMLLALAAEDAAQGFAHASMIARWAPLVGTLQDDPLENLVSGHWLRSELGLQEGPEMARCFNLVRDAEIAGEVNSEESAKSYLMNYCRQQ